MGRRLHPVDMATEPYLTGVFEPVDTEVDAEDLPVIGTIPADLRGVYLRDGQIRNFRHSEGIPIHSTATA